MTWHPDIYIYHSNSHHLHLVFSSYFNLKSIFTSWSNCNGYQYFDVCFPCIIFNVFIKRLMSSFFLHDQLQIDELVQVLKLGGKKSGKEIESFAHVLSEMQACLKVNLFLSYFLLLH